MVVQHNLQAMNANRMLGVTAKSAASSTEKLSSGYRINRAADDAAGLAISEKMRKQIRGLDRASLNAEDGISSVQTAEGALTEVHDMLQRMNELCVQAANGTNSESDRQAIQNELDQLVTEIDRVAETTKFNDTYLLKGDEVKTTKKQYTINYSIENTPNRVSNAAGNGNALPYKVNYTGINNVYITSSSVLSQPSSVAVSAKTVGTGNDITDYMVSNIKDKYTYTLKNATAADVATTTTLAVSYKVPVTTTLAATAGNGTNTTIDTKSYYAVGSDTAGDLDTLLSKVVVDESTGKIMWDPSINPKPQYYFDADNGSTMGSQSDLITDDLLDTWINGAIVAGEVAMTTTGLFASNTPGAADMVTGDDLKNYFDPSMNGYYSDIPLGNPGGNPLYAIDPTDPSQRVPVGANKILTILDVKSIDDGLYIDQNDPLTLATEDDLTSIIDPFDPKSFTGLYVYDKDPDSATYGDLITLDPTNLGSYVDMTSVKAADEAASDNKAGAIFNDKDYTAFVSVELNSNVATGDNGKVSADLTTGADTDADLSTDGTSGVVRANKDLYVFEESTGTVRHLSKNDDMTDYLNDDNTMKAGYKLVDYLTGPSGETSQRVREQMLGAAKDDTSIDFVWDNNYIENDRSMQKLYDVNGKEVSGMGLGKFFDNNGNYMGGLYTTSQARAIDQVFDSALDPGYENIVNGGHESFTIDQFISKSSKEVSGDLDFKLHVGADGNEENKIAVNIKSLTAAGLGIDKIHSSLVGIVDSTGANATAAIDVIAEAIQKVSTQRSNLGAIQNRLEHTIKNLDNVAENTQAAESQIRDTDMATEMVRHSNTNVLQQAGQSMLAQANQANQGVLSLLQ